MTDFTNLLVALSVGGWSPGMNQGVHDKADLRGEVWVHEGTSLKIGTITKNSDDAKIAFR